MGQVGKRNAGVLYSTRNPNSGTRANLNPEPSNLFILGYGLAHGQAFKLEGNHMPWVGVSFGDSSMQGLRVLLTGDIWPLIRRCNG